MEKKVFFLAEYLNDEREVDFMRRDNYVYNI